MSISPRDAPTVQRKTRPRAALSPSWEYSLARLATAVRIEAFRDTASASDAACVITHVLHRSGHEETSTYSVALELYSALTRTRNLNSEAFLNHGARRRNGDGSIEHMSLRVRSPRSTSSEIDPPMFDVADLSKYAFETWRRKSGGCCTSVTLTRGVRPRRWRRCLCRWSSCGRPRSHRPSRAPRCLMPERPHREACGAQRKHVLEAAIAMGGIPDAEVRELDLITSKAELNLENKQSRCRDSSYRESRLTDSSERTFSRSGIASAKSLCLSLPNLSLKYPGTKKACVCA